jgi:hypothetical protein
MGLVQKIKDAITSVRLSKHDAYKKERLGKFVDVDMYPKS